MPVLIIYITQNIEEGGWLEVGSGEENHAHTNERSEDVFKPVNLIKKKAWTMNRKA